MVIEDFLNLKSVTSRSENLKSRVTKVTGIFYFIFFCYRDVDNSRILYKKGNIAENDVFLLDSFQIFCSFIANGMKWNF